MRRISLRNPIPHRLPETITEPIGRTVARTGLTPNVISVIGVTGNLVAGGFAGAGWFIPAGLTMVVFSGVDLLDGAVARATGRATKFGAVFDATLDRVSEAAVLFGLLWHYTSEGERTESLLIYAA
ncbi:MAG TPA: CDP-alcohol phosphatidyltransferase family protein, partial [Dehalococcoidia bacterium]|nr:CDP-alcohol phosphatidyltransferase family protein [Dehalococcoidia bacterium]